MIIFHGRRPFFEIILRSQTKELPNEIIVSKEIVYDAFSDAPNQCGSKYTIVFIDTIGEYFFSETICQDEEDAFEKELSDNYTGHIDFLNVTIDLRDSNIHITDNMN